MLSFNGKKVLKGTLEDNNIHNEDLLHLTAVRGPTRICAKGNVRQENGQGIAAKRPLDKQELSGNTPSSGDLKKIRYNFIDFALLHLKKIHYSKIFIKFSVANCNYGPILIRKKIL